MLHGLKKITLALALALGGLGAGASSAEAVTPVVFARVDVQGLEELESRWAVSLAQREAFQAKMRGLEAEYERATRDIEEIKRGGVDNLRRPELERKLRLARESAMELDGLQCRIKTLDALLTDLAARIVTRLDVRRDELERDLVRAKPARRAGLVKELNDLSAKRAEYARPLERIDSGQFVAVMKGADAIDDPEEMLALADELQDAEAQARAKLGELESQLDELKARRRLLRRARSFSREESFFEEGAQGRTFVARVANRSNANQPEESGSGNNAAPVEQSANNVIGDGDPTVNAPVDVVDSDAAPSDGGDAAAEDPGYDDGAAAPHMGAEDDNGFGKDVESGDTDHGVPGSRGPAGESFDDAGDSPVLAPDTAGGGAQDDPYDTPRDALVIERQADPDVAGGKVKVEDARLDKRIKTIEAEKKALEGQAVELKARAERLRRRAGEEL